MPTFEIELDEAQVAALTMYANGVGLTPTECIKMGVLWTIQIELMRVTGTTPTHEEWPERLARVEDSLNRIIDGIIAERDVPQGNPFDTPEDRPTS